MTRSDLIDALTSKFPMLVAKDVEVSVKAIVDAISGALASGNRIEIRDFGAFSLKQRKARHARNPKTGETVSVPDKWVPHFKPGKELRARVDKTDQTKTRSRRATSSIAPGSF